MSYCLLVSCSQFAQQEVDMEALSDRQDGLHFALVEVGGYVRTHDLTPAQRRHMYTQEVATQLADETLFPLTLKRS